MNVLTNAPFTGGLHIIYLGNLGGQEVRLKPLNKYVNIHTYFLLPYVPPPPGEGGWNVERRKVPFKSKDPL